MEFSIQFTTNVLFRSLAFYILMFHNSMEAFIFVYVNATFFGTIFSFSVLQRAMNPNTQSEDIHIFNNFQLLLLLFVAGTCWVLSDQWLLLYIGIVLTWYAETAFADNLVKNKKFGASYYYITQSLWPALFLVTFLLTDGLAITFFYYFLAFSLTILAVSKLEPRLEYWKKITFEFSVRLKLLSVGIIEASLIPSISYLCYILEIEEMFIESIRLISISSIFLFLFGNLFQYFGRRYVDKIFSVRTKMVTLLSLVVLFPLFQETLTQLLVILSNFGGFSFENTLLKSLAIYIYAVGCIIWQWKFLYLANRNLFKLVIFTQIMVLCAASGLIFLMPDPFMLILVLGLVKFVAGMIFE